MWNRFYGVTKDQRLERRRRNPSGRRVESKVKRGSEWHSTQVGRTPSKSFIVHGLTSRVRLPPMLRVQGPRTWPLVFEPLNESSPLAGEKNGERRRSRVNNTPQGKEDRFSSGSDLFVFRLDDAACNTSEVPFFIRVTRSRANHVYHSVILGTQFWNSSSWSYFIFVIINFQQYRLEIRNNSYFKHIFGKGSLTKNKFLFRWKPVINNFSKRKRMK